VVRLILNAAKTRVAPSGGGVPSGDDA